MLNYTLTFTIRTNSISDENFKEDLCITACKQYCLAAGATQGNIAYTQTVRRNATSDSINFDNRTKNRQSD